MDARLYVATCPVCGSRDEYTRPDPAEHTCGHREGQRKHLVLHVEIPGFWADDLDECAAVLSDPEPAGAEDRLFVVTEEWMREEVGITLVSLPGEKNLSDDFEVHAYTGRIVGAETRDAGATLAAPASAAPLADDVPPEAPHVSRSLTASPEGTT